MSRAVKAGPRGRKPREKPPSNGTSVHSIPIVLLRNDKIACGCVAASGGPRWKVKGARVLLSWAGREFKRRRRPHARGKSMEFSFVFR